MSDRGLNSCIDQAIVRSIPQGQGLRSRSTGIFASLAMAEIPTRFEGK